MQRLSPAGRSAAARRHRDAALVRPNAVGSDAEHGAPLVTVPAEDSPRSRVGDHAHEMPLEQAERAIQMVGGEIPGEEAVCISLHP